MTGEVELRLVALPDISIVPTFLLELAREFLDVTNHARLEMH